MLQLRTFAEEGAENSNGNDNQGEDGDDYQLVFELLQSNAEIFLQWRVAEIGGRGHSSSIDGAFFIIVVITRSSVTRTVKVEHILHVGLRIDLVTTFTIAE